MNIHSRFLQSEMIFWRHGSEVIEHSDHIIIRTPSNPSWRWGNLILLEGPPKLGDLERWTRLSEISFGPSSPDRLYVWDTPTGETGEIQPFLEDGYRFTRQPLLSSSELIPPLGQDASVITRELTTERDWKQNVLLNVATFANGEQGYEMYIRRKFDLYRRMIDGGLGLWLGVFVEDRLIASCGIFHDDEITRYQEVLTDEPFRNRGICTRLVHDAFTHARLLGYPDLTLIAVDGGTQAERIYRKLGFADCEMTCALRKTPGGPVRTSKKTDHLSPSR